MATNFRVKMGKIGRLAFALAFLNEVEYRNFHFIRFICDDL